MGFGAFIGKSLKVNVIAWLEFELPYNDIAVHLNLGDSLHEELLRWVKSIAIFAYMIVYGVYITRPKQFKSLELLVVVGRIMVVGALTRCA